MFLHFLNPYPIILCYIYFILVTNNSPSQANPTSLVYTPSTTSSVAQATSTDAMTPPRPNDHENQYEINSNQLTGICCLVFSRLLPPGYVVSGHKVIALHYGHQVMFKSSGGFVLGSSENNIPGHNVIWLHFS